MCVLGGVNHQERKKARGRGREIKSKVEVKKEPEREVSTYQNSRLRRSAHARNRVSEGVVRAAALRNAQLRKGSAKTQRANSADRRPAEVHSTFALATFEAGICF